MTTALILWGYAALLATAGAIVMQRARWVDRAPRLGIVAWQALSVSVVLAVAFGGLAVVVPTDVVSMNLAKLVDSCAMLLSAQYATPGGAAVATTGLTVAAVVFGRWMYCTVEEFSRSAAVRRRHHQVLAMVGRASQEPGVTLLDDTRPYVYCVAGRRHRIVMTTGASEMLDAVQVSAVLAHERAHLRGRHHLAIAAAAAMARAFPRIPLFIAARDEITRMLELTADDAASRKEHRLTLAEAMLTLAVAAPPSGALAARGTAAGERVRRLITGHRPLARWAAGMAWSAALTLVVAPLIALTTPAVTAGPDCCTAEQQQPLAVADLCTAASRNC